MNRKKCSVALRVMAFLLAMVMFLPTSAKAATTETVQPCASYYLDSYSAYIYPAANGKIQVYFSVTGIGYLGSLGALHISIYQSLDQNNWHFLKKYSYTDYPSMLSYNDNYHSGCVEYQGVVGRYYMAYVCIWGGNDGVGDTRYFYTSAKRAVQTPS